MELWHFNGPAQETEYTNAVGIRSIYKVNARILEDADGDHIGAKIGSMASYLPVHKHRPALSHCITIRIPSVHDETVDELPSDLTPRQIRTYAQEVIDRFGEDVHRDLGELNDRGDLWIQFFNEPVNGAGAAKDDNEFDRIIRFTQYAQEIVRRRFKNVKVVGPGLADGSIDLIAARTSELDPRRAETQEKVNRILALNNALGLYTDVHLHSAADDVDRKLGIVWYTYTSRFIDPPRLVSTEFSVAKIPPSLRDPDFEYPSRQITEGLEACERYDLHFAAHTCYTGQALPRPFQWPNIWNSDNTERQEWVLERLVAYTEGDETE